jgi:TolA-binding protein
MKRPLLLAGLLSGLVCLPLSLSAQDPAAIAAREEAEARYTRMNTRVQELEEANVSFQKRMQALTEEIRGLRDEIDRLRSKNDNAATQESLKRLTDAVQDIEKKRQADKELVLERFKELAKLAQAKPPGVDKPPSGTAVRPPPVGSDKSPGDGAKPGPTVPENGYEYAIKKGDTLEKILRDLKAHDIKVNQKQVENANPGVNWNRLKIGQKIFIPAPAQ